MIHIAIIGSGPSGCYIADMLSKKRSDIQVDVYDRLPTPFGLVRTGVAPDHQGTKNIVQQFERTFLRENVRFAGNVTIGRDVSYQALKTHYDLIAVTTGAQEDRTTDIEGEKLQGVYGSGAFVGWYNNHPDQDHLKPALDGTGIAIIGNGNVALDIARVLAKTDSEMEGSDISPDVASAIATSPVTDIYLIGRRGPVEASFTAAALNEFNMLERCVPLVDPAQIPAALPDDMNPVTALMVGKKLEFLRTFAANQPDDKPLRLHFLFYATPVEILDDKGRAGGLRLAKNHLINKQPQATGETFDLPVQTVISAIGYHSQPIIGMPFDEKKGIVSHQDGLIEESVYAAGWCKCGPQGVIPTNRVDAMAIAKRMITDLEARPLAGTKSGFREISQLLQRHHIRVVSFEDWQTISAAETASAADNRTRKKFNSINEMLAILD
ncbi:MAG: FAD-dependent oxidoreductase [Pontibacterium sp.]